MKIYKLIRVTEHAPGVFWVEGSKSGARWTLIESCGSEESAFKSAEGIYTQQLNISKGPRVIKTWTIGENTDG